MENYMVSHNRYRIYEGRDDTLYFFLLDKNGKATYAVGDDLFRDDFLKRITMFEYEAYQMDARQFQMMKFYHSLPDPNELMKKVENTCILIADEKGRYEHRFGSFAKKCFAPAAFYFSYPPVEKAQMPSIINGEYVKVIATDINTARCWMKLCYPSMINHVQSYSGEFYEDEWRNGGNRDFVGKEPYEVITKESMEKEFGTSALVDPDKKVRFGKKVVKPRKITPYMTKKENEALNTISEIFYGQDAKKVENR